MRRTSFLFRLAPLLPKLNEKKMKLKEKTLRNYCHISMHKMALFCSICFETWWSVVGHSHQDCRRMRTGAIQILGKGMHCDETRQTQVWVLALTPGAGCLPSRSSVHLFC